MKFQGQGSDALFLALAAPKPLPSAGALVDPLVVPLCSSGSWWSLFWLLTGRACGGPPVCDKGAVGAGPCGMLSAGPEGWLWALLFLGCLGLLRMVFSLLPSLDNECCCYCGWVDMLPTLGGTNLPWTCLLVMDPSGLYEAFPWGWWWASLRSATSLCACSCCVLCGALLFSWCWCQGSSFYHGLLVSVGSQHQMWLDLFVQTEPHVIQFERP